MSSRRYASFDIAAGLSTVLSGALAIQPFNHLPARRGRKTVLSYPAQIVCNKQLLGILYMLLS